MTAAILSRRAFRRAAEAGPEDSISAVMRRDYVIHIDEDFPSG